jgi:DNA-binding winged helix-turn-helix (wHTH) protein/tetratricopeptide (TPR) repeat protein
MGKIVSSSVDLPGSGYSFGSFRLEADGTLFRSEIPVLLTPRELTALRLLLAQAGQVVPPTQLRHALWDDRDAGSDSVARCIASLRARLEPEECIQTVYKRGYRFSVKVRPHADGAGSQLRLAILPFFTGFDASEYLSFALAEETAARLNGLHHAAVSVPAQDSVFTLARRGLDALQIGTAVGADLVLTGSLSTLPAHYRLRAEMTRVRDGAPLWVEDNFIDKTQPMDLGAELARYVSIRLANGSLSIFAVAESPAEKQKGGAERQQAYEIYQRAHQEWQTLQRHQMQDGLHKLLRAIELDPALTAARVDLVNLCMAESVCGFLPPSAAANLARRVKAPGPPAAVSGRWEQTRESSAAGSASRNAEYADSCAPDSEAILPVMGWIEFHEGRNLAAALRAFSASAHLPHNPWITRARIMFALSRRHFGEAIEMLRAAIRLDPYAAWMQGRLAWALHLAGEAAASMRQMEYALAQFPEDDGVNLCGASILSYHGEAARGTELARGLTERCPYMDLATASYAYALACARREDEARAILERLEWLSRERFVLNSFTPAVHVALGDHDAALAELRQLNQARCPWFFQTLADPRLTPLHGRPEFAEMQSILPEMEAGEELAAAPAYIQN